jgi:type I restriction enzyme S subunit
MSGQSLPVGWRWVRLGDVCAPKVINRDPGREPNAEFVYIDITSIDSVQKIAAQTKTLLGKDAPSRARQVIAKGDVIVSTTRPNLNAIAQISPELDGQICSTGFCVLRPIPGELDSDFLFHFVQTQGFIQNLSDLVKGALYPAVTDKDVRNQLIPLPSLDEQRRIAAALNAQMECVVQARRAAEEQLRAAKELPSAYLREVFGNSATNKWSWRKLGDVCELLSAKTIKTIGDTVVTAITTACLSENGFLATGLKSARMDANDAKQALVQKGEILIARSNTPDLVGRVSMYPGEPPKVFASDLTIRIWANPDCYPPFLTAYLSFLYLSGYWKEHAGGASGTMKKITRSQVLEVMVPVPGMESQKEIMVEMQDKMDNVKALRLSLEAQLAEIGQLPSALLRRAFAGET